MSSGSVKQEEQNKFQMPANVDLVANWMQQSYPFVNFQFPVPAPPNSDVPPPPPALPSIADAVQQLEVRVKSFDDAVKQYTTVIKVAIYECEHAPNDAAGWKQLEGAHDQSVVNPTKMFRREETNIERKLGFARNLNGAQNYTKRLNDIASYLDDLDYDDLLDKYQDARQQATKRIAEAVSVSKELTKKVLVLKAEFEQLSKEPAQGANIMSWNPNVPDSKFSKFMERADEYSSQVQPPKRSTDLQRAFAELTATIEVVRGTLLKDVAKYGLFEKEAESIAQLCQQTVLDAEADDFDVAPWNPIAGGHEWKGLLYRYDIICTLTKGAPLSKEVKLALDVFEDLRAILLAKVADVTKKAEIEASVAAEMTKAASETKELDQQLDQLLDQAKTLVQEIDEVVIGTGCNSLGQRQARWYALKKDALPLPGFPWEVASAQYFRLGDFIVQMGALMPWGPKSLKELLTAFSSMDTKYEDVKKAVDTASKAFNRYNAAVCEFDADSDIDLDAVSGAIEQATSVADDFRELTDRAQTFMGVARQILQMDNSYERQTAWQQADRSWRPVDGSPWSDAELLLKEIESVLEAQSSRLPWKPAIIDQLTEAVKGARRAKGEGGKHLKQAMKLYEEIDNEIRSVDVDDLLDEGNVNDQIIDDDEIVTNIGQTPGNLKTPGYNDMDADVSKEEDIDNIVINDNEPAAGKVTPNGNDDYLKINDGDNDSVIIDDNDSVIIDEETQKGGADDQAVLNKLEQIRGAASHLVEQAKTALREANAQHENGIPSADEWNEFLKMIRLPADALWAKENSWDMLLQSVARLEQDAGDVSDGVAEQLTGMDAVVRQSWQQVTQVLQRIQQLSQLVAQGPQPNNQQNNDDNNKDDDNDPNANDNGKPNQAMDPKHVLDKLEQVRSAANHLMEQAESALEDANDQHTNGVPSVQQWNEFLQMTRLPSGALWTQDRSWQMLLDSLERLRDDAGDINNELAQKITDMETTVKDCQRRAQEALQKINQLTQLVVGGVQQPVNQPNNDDSDNDDDGAELSKSDTWSIGTEPVPDDYVFPGGNPNPPKNLQKKQSFSSFVDSAEFELSESSNVNQNDNDADYDDDQQSGVSAETIKTFEKEFAERFKDWDTRNDQQQLMQALQLRLQAQYGIDEDVWKEHSEDVIFMLWNEKRKKQKQAEEPEQKLVDNGFELTEKYWKNAKGTWVDRKGLLSAKLTNYEKHLTMVEFGSGYQRLHLVLALNICLDEIEITAKVIHDGLGTSTHTKSRKVLEGVPYAVSQGRKASEQIWQETIRRYAKARLETVRRDKDVSDLWNKFLKDTKRNQAYHDQHEFLFLYDTKGASEELRTFVKDNLNLKGAKFDFELNDEEAWLDIRDRVLSQLRTAFTGPFHTWVEDKARGRL